MFGRSSQSLLGVDISSSVVKVLELGKKGSKYTVEAYAAEPLPEKAVVESGIENKEEVANAIKRAIKRSGSKLKDAAVAVPDNATIKKILSYPAELSDREMEEQIMLEAETHIPYPLEEVRLDFEVLGPTASDETSVDVLLAASRSKNVDIRVEVLEMAGLKPRLIDVEAYTVENAYTLLSSQLPIHGQGLTVAIVDIGATVTTLHVFVDGTIVFTHEQKFGGRMLTENIAQHYGISIAEAGEAKKENNLPDDYHAQVLGPFKNMMTSTVTRALQFFFSTSSQYEAIDHILLSGGCASIDGVDSMIETASETPTIVANPFVEMKLGSKVHIAALGNDAPSMLIACGLALRSFD